METLASFITWAVEALTARSHRCRLSHDGAAKRFMVSLFEEMDAVIVCGKRGAKRAFAL
jgi:hypothetical protein